MTLYVLAYVILCTIVAMYGSKREFGFYGFFIACLVFTPLIVFVLLLLTKPDKERQLEK